MSPAAAVPLALAVALFAVTATFVIARLRGRYDTIDTTWGAGFALIAAVSFATGRTGALPAAVVVVWGIRLAVHLHRRNAGLPEDPRYVEMAAGARRFPALRMFARVYLVQGVVMWFVALPVLFAGPGVGVFTAVGAAVWAVGMFFEAVGDEQLRRFRADPANAGRVLDRGLWRYTRHPNYFGDACVWWGAYLMACQHWPGPLAVLSPLLMTWLLARGTGKPVLERRLREHRPEYAAYVERTSGFLPLPPKRR
ncbi:DUF1295 domain-containing protein [Saccharopolyspora endophytica]|uniref:DUF1295 domain-containing protein n=1 Tax=Saccharopolyspora endophytica TaxID=543886 RepID=A0ABS5DFF0_9PSEU|nr:DUF1295 domain-containing protein [Saccharopolyspora endophytica]MBQ0925008.1 DUF1295 domain-containing protein [Saccharopolyspora endophytica]